jgi:hypothetical protein
VPELVRVMQQVLVGVVVPIRTHCDALMVDRSLE